MASAGAHTIYYPVASSFGLLSVRTAIYYPVASSFGLLSVRTALLSLLAESVTAAGRREARATHARAW